MTALPRKEGDAEIIRLLQTGDVTGVELLLRTYGGQVKQWLRSGFRRRDGDHDLEDAVHDAARALLRYAKRLNAEGNLAGYFYRTARNVMVGIMQKGKWHAALVDGLESQVAAPVGDQQPPCKLSQRIAEVIDTLPDLEREILMFDVAYNFGLCAAELAKLVGTTPGTVYSLRNRIKARLKPLLPGQDAGGGST